MLAPRAAAWLLRVGTARRAAAFQRALESPARAQRAVLARILRACGRTEYGRSLGIAPMQGPDEFRARVPISDYAALEPWIARQRASGGAVIAPGRVRGYQPTSGSGGAAKRIPYNDALLNTFRSLFHVWAHDLLMDGLSLRSGRTFISVSPPQPSAGELQDDREYLGPALRLLIGRYLVAPPRVSPGDMAGFRDGLAQALVACADLEIVSIWSPSYLLILLEHIGEHRVRFRSGLSDPRRAALMRDPPDWPGVWPQLQLVSCWTSAAAAGPAARLAKLLPHARLQGKGLLCTEGPVTVPLTAAAGCVPLLDEVFLELEQADGRLVLLQDAEIGREYSILVTQPGGLLRYRVGDRVRVTGRFKSSPVIRFEGRADAVSDIVGEKLDEAFVGEVLRRHSAPGSFCLLLPVQPEAERPYYHLLTDDPRTVLADGVERGLMDSYRYREARLLGQLDAVRATVRGDMRRRYQDALAADGMRAGDIKERTLLPSLDRARRLLAQLG